MKSSFFQATLISLLIILLGIVFPNSGHATTNTNQNDNWGKATSAYKTASTWASTPNSGTSSGQQESIPEIESLKKRMGEFITQGMEEMQKKGYAEPQS